MKILIIGDLHIPYRSSELPNIFKNEISSMDVQQVLCTGNICTITTLKYLQTICENLYCVNGELDENMNNQETFEFTFGEFKILLISSYLCFCDELVKLKHYQYNADIIIKGGSHKPSVEEHDDFVCIDPGTGTGAFGLNGDSATYPSYVILDIKSNIAEATTYKIINDAIVKEVHQFQKKISS